MGSMCVGSVGYEHVYWGHEIRVMTNPVGAIQDEMVDKKLEESRRGLDRYGWVRVGNPHLQCSSQLPSCNFSVNERAANTPRFRNNLA